MYSNNKTNHFKEKEIIIIIVTIIINQSDEYGKN